MACEVCEHCQEPFAPDDDVALREEYSYHEKCHKCYVCSETNLRDAELFRGVIFCSSCSQRIFRGCDSARRTKEKSKKRRSHRSKERRRDSSSKDGILELAGLDACTDSSKSGSESATTAVMSKSPVLLSECTLQPDVNLTRKTKTTKKTSVEMGMTTEITQELLKQMKCPVIADVMKSAQQVTPNKEYAEKSLPCSDMRIAELGASTEIASMALRNKHEMPVIIKSMTRSHDSKKRGIVCCHLKTDTAMSHSKESDDSGIPREEWLDPAYSTVKDSTRTQSHWMDRRLGSILKLPYRSFKRRILRKSSVINMLLKIDQEETSRKKIWHLFTDNVNAHRRRGIKKLYSTINRKKIPYKMGWLKASDAWNSERLLRSKYCQYCQECKHFRKSHSYRCMRAQVMRSAGPTKSELEMIRSKLKNLLMMNYIKNLPFYFGRYPAIMMSEACGSSLVGSTRTAIHST